MEKDIAPIDRSEEEVRLPALWLVSVERISERDQAKSRHPASLLQLMEAPPIPSRAS